MKSTRLEELYHRKLVSPDHARRRFPLEQTLKRELEYFPHRPESPDYDILEIGPGTGDFLMHLAETHPEKKILGVELGRARFIRIRERLEKREISNVTLVHGDARALLNKDLATARFERIYVLFPDPWPKTRHAHQRLLSREFVDTLLPTLRPGGNFILITDVKDYATWAQKNLASFPEMSNAHPQDGFAAIPTEIIPTFFAKKWQQLGRSQFAVHFVCVL